jgi:hypothetical protein
MGASDKPRCRSSDAVMPDYGGKRAPHGSAANRRAHEQEQRHMDDLNPLPGAVPGAEKKPRGRPFAPGVSGNPKGRPKGSRNKATVIVEALREGEAEALTRKLVEKALAGDSAALRMCVKRLWAPKRGRRVEFDLPELNAGGAATASWAILKACAAGTLSPREAHDVMGLIPKHFQTLKVSELEAKVAELEARRRA